MEDRAGWLNKEFCVRGLISELARRGACQSGLKADLVERVAALRKLQNEKIMEDYVACESTQAYEPASKEELTERDSQEEVSFVSHAVTQDWAEFFILPRAGRPGRGWLGL